MSFNSSVPNASKSPANFPPQNIKNMTRLKEIINAEHNFTNALSPSQGIHRQCTFINKTAIPVVLTAGNGILFSFPDADGNSQLNWYNGVKNVQITPFENLAPIRLVGSASVASGNTADILNVPYDFTGTGHAYIQSTANFRWCFTEFIRYGNFKAASEIKNGGNSSDPVIAFAVSGNALVVKNNASTTQTLIWTLIYNKNS